MQIKKVLGDGHCLFTAAFEMLKAHFPNLKNFQSIRDEIVKFYKSEEGNSFIKDRISEDIDSYIEGISNEEWGDSTELIAIGEIFNCNITIFKPNEQFDLVNKPQHKITLYFVYNGLNHYDYAIHVLKNNDVGKRHQNNGIQTSHINSLNIQNNELEESISFAFQKLIFKLYQIIDFNIQDLDKFTKLVEAAKTISTLFNCLKELVKSIPLNYFRQGWDKSTISKKTLTLDELLDFIIDVKDNFITLNSSYNENTWKNKVANVRNAINDK